MRPRATRKTSTAGPEWLRRSTRPRRPDAAVIARLDATPTASGEALTKVDSRGEADGMQHIRREYRSHNTSMCDARWETSTKCVAWGEAPTQDDGRGGGVDDEHGGVWRRASRRSAQRMSTRVSDDLGWLSNLKSVLVSNSTGPSCGSPRRAQSRGVADRPPRSRPRWRGTIRESRHAIAHRRQTVSAL